MRTLVTIHHPTAQQSAVAATRPLALMACTVLLLLGCGGNDSSDNSANDPDGGYVDAALADVTRPNDGAAEAGFGDSGAADAGIDDSGIEDSGTEDGGEPDSSLTVCPPNSVDASSFGLDGTSNADQSAQLQTALESDAPLICLSPGTYNINTPIVVGSGVQKKLVGLDGTTISGKLSDFGVLIKLKINVAFENLTTST